MYSPNASGHNLLQQLRILFKCLNCLGLTGVTFNPKKERFEQTRRKQKVAYCVYSFMQYTTGCLIFVTIMLALSTYLSTSSYQSPKSVEGQESFISFLTGYIHITSTFIYTLYYFRIRGRLLDLFNEALRIHQKLKARSGPDLTLNPTMMNFLIVKAIILVLETKSVFVCGAIMFFIMPIISINYSLLQIFNALMVWSYLYIQLLLLSFYDKMNEYLSTCGGVMGRRELKKCLRECISISKRIHSFKSKLKGFSNCVFMCTFIGLFHDIEFLYLLLKINFYAKYISNRGHLLKLNSMYIPACMYFTFDMLVIGALSDALQDANGKFQEKVWKLSECIPSLQRRVDMMLMHDNICDLQLWAFGQFKISQEFSFDFASNTVLIFAVVFLQFFAAEQVYTKDFKKITIDRDFFVDL